MSNRGGSRRNNSANEYNSIDSAAQALQNGSDYQSCIDESISYLAVRSGMISLKKLMKTQRKYSGESMKMEQEDEGYESCKIINDNDTEESIKNCNSPS